MQINLGKRFNLRDIPEELRIRDWGEADPFADALALLGIKDFSPLTRFPNLRRLWVPEAKQHQLDVIGQLTRLESLNVSLRPSANDLRPLGNLTSLRDLSFDGQIEGASLEPLARLTQLRHLYISQLISAMKALYFDTLAPLGSLTKLEHLELYGIRARDDTLVPLAHLTNLKTLGLSNYWPVAEFARLSAALPHTEGIFRGPILVFERRAGSQRFPCGKCGIEEPVMLIGRVRPRLACPVCDAKRIERHVAEYERLKREFQASSTPQ